MRMTINQESASNILDRVEDIAHYLKGLSDRVEDEGVKNALTKAIVKLWPISATAERIINQEDRIMGKFKCK